MNQSEFLKLWSREAANVPGIPIETMSLTSSPILTRPIMRKEEKAA